MMSFTEPETQALGAIADGLAGSDPRLASMLTTSAGWPVQRISPRASSRAEYGVPEGAGLRNSGSRRMAS
jgi:hypothetical protein